MSPLQRFEWILEVGKRLPNRAAATLQTAVALAYRASNGICHPSIQCLAHDTGSEPRTVQRAIRTLVEMGFLMTDFTAGRGRTNTYRLTQKPDGTVTLLSRENLTVRSPFEQGKPDGAVAFSDGEKVTVSAEKGDGESTKKVTAPSPGTRKEHRTEHSPASAGRRNGKQKGPGSGQLNLPGLEDLGKKSTRGRKSKSEVPKKINGGVVWAAWVNLHRRLGKADPARIPPDQKAGKTLAEVFTNEAEMESCLRQYRQDPDSYLAKQGHALRHLPGRVNAYRQEHHEAKRRAAEETAAIERERAEREALARQTPEEKAAAAEAIKALEDWS